MALRKQKITIDHTNIGSALTDYPMLVTRVHLDDEVVDPSGSNAAQADGGDLKFYSDSALTNRIACEVVHFEHDSSTGAGDAVIEIHVALPSVSAVADTDVWVTYNEPSPTSQPARNALYGSESVWGANFAGVYHHSDDPSDGSTTDSTANLRHGSAAGGMTSGDVVVGKVGKALDFDGVDDHIQLPQVSPTSYHFSAWIYTRTYLNGATNDGSGTYFMDRAITGLGNPLAGLKAVADQFVHQVRYDDGTNLSGVFGGAIVNETWQFIEWGREHGVKFFIANNTSETTAPDSGSALTLDPSLIGAHASLFVTANALIDEFRFSTAVPSTDFREATYLNQSSPAAFATAGTPEDAAGGGGDPVALVFDRRYSYKHVPVTDQPSIRQFRHAEPVVTPTGLVQRPNRTRLDLSPYLNRTSRRLKLIDTETIPIQRPSPHVPEVYPYTTRPARRKSAADAVDLPVLESTRTYQRHELQSLLAIRTPQNRRFVHPPEQATPDFPPWYAVQTNFFLD